LRPTRGELGKKKKVRNHEDPGKVLNQNHKKPPKIREKKHRGVKDSAELTFSSLAQIKTIEAILFMQQKGMKKNTNGGELGGREGGLQ